MKSENEYQARLLIFPSFSANITEVPSQLVIQDENRKPVISGQLGPLMEGNKLSIFCVSSGGKI